MLSPLQTSSLSTQHEEPAQPSCSSAGTSAALPRCSSAEAGAAAATGQPAGPVLLSRSSGNSGSSSSCNLAAAAASAADDPPLRPPSPRPSAGQLDLLQAELALQLRLDVTRVLSLIRYPLMQPDQLRAVLALPLTQMLPRLGELVLEALDSHSPQGHGADGGRGGEGGTV